MSKFARFSGFAAVTSFTLIPTIEKNRVTSHIIEKAEANINGTWRNPATIKIDNMVLEIENDWTAHDNEKPSLINNSYNSYGQMEMFAVELLSKAKIEILLTDNYDNISNENLFDKMTALKNTINNDKLTDITTFHYHSWKFVEIVEISPAKRN